MREEPIIKNFDRGFIQIIQQAQGEAESHRTLSLQSNVYQELLIASRPIEEKNNEVEEAPADIATGQNEE